MQIIQFLSLCLLAVVASAAEGPATFKVSDLTFTRPTAWEWVPSTSSMRAAQLKVSEGQQAAEVVFFHFGPGGAGGTQANVDRWLGQFEEPREKLNPKVESATVNGTKVTYVQAQGTYSSGMPGGPKTPMANYALLGAIIEASAGHVFVRMTGPAVLVKNAQPEFRKMVESSLKK